MANEFHIGDHVLIVGGINENHRKLMGHDTYVTSELMHLYAPMDANPDQPLVGIHRVTETQEGKLCASPCYRPGDLMHLKAPKERKVDQKIRELNQLMEDYIEAKQLKTLMNEVTTDEEA